MLTPDERQVFERDGVVALRGAANAAAVGELRAALQARIAASAATLTPSQLADLAKQHEFAATWGPRVMGAVDDLLGSGRWELPKAAGQVLFASAPTPGARWDVPHSVWHLDYSAPGSARTLPGVQLFVCLDRVAPRAGGTVVIAGVHRAIDGIRRRAGDAWPGRSKDVRRELHRASRWFRDLCSTRPGEDRVGRFMAGAGDQVCESLRVVELTGEPGDVHVVHPWSIHAPAPSCGDRPRLALSERIRAREG
ncbi:MAG TPA: phytanoyl-CoA dioxygenase family protein [Myxococcota bacterium]|nr:phytanoyl-CoA dioxygenase family protein [Myxococcota bacterium]